MKYKLLIIFSFVVLSSSCQTSNENTIVKLIDGDELKLLLDKDDIQFIDVRTQEEFNEKRIEGAKNIVYDNNFKQKLSKLDKDKPVIVYCRSGRRSASSAIILKDNGFTEIYNLKGGILQWINDGNKVE